MIPLDNMVFVVMFIVSGMIQGVVYVYFLNNYLEPKYGRKSTWFFSLGFIFYTLLILFVFYSEAYFRIFTTILFLSSSALFFYKGKLTRKLFSGVLLYIISGISDITAQFIIVFVFQYHVFDTLPNHLLLIILILSNIIIFILAKLALKLTTDSHSFTNRYSKIFISMLLNILFVSIAFSIAFYTSNFFTYIFTSIHQYQRGLFIIVICSLFSCILIIYIARTLPQLKSSLAKELLIQSIHQQNMEQLQQFLDTKKNLYNTSELRHDIINYLQTVKTLKEDDKHE